MHKNIALFADVIIVMMLVLSMSVLMQVDPRLPLLWAASTLFMTWQH